MHVSASFTLPGVKTDRLVNLTSRQVRAMFKELGYKASLRTNPCTDKLVSLYVSGNGIESPVMLSTSSAYPTDFYEKHIRMFRLAGVVRSQVLSDTGQKVS